MSQQIRPWLLTGALGVMGGFLYWAVANRFLGLTQSLLVEHLVVGAVVGIAVQAFSHFRSSR